MPLVRIDLRRGKSPDYRRAICASVYRAMRESFAVPDEDRFMIVTEHEETDFVFSDRYLDIARSEDLVIIQVTANDTRTLAQKKAFYAQVAALLAENPGLRPQDVFVNLVEVAKENWSFGNGIAQYA